MLKFLRSDLNSSAESSIKVNIFIISITYKNRHEAEGSKSRGQKKKKPTIKVICFLDFKFFNYNEVEKKPTNPRQSRRKKKA